MICYTDFEFVHRTLEIRHWRLHTGVYSVWNCDNFYIFQNYIIVGHFIDFRLFTLCYIWFANSVSSYILPFFFLEKAGYDSDIVTLEDLIRS